MTSMLMLALLFNNTVLLIKPPVTVTNVYLQYQLSNSLNIEPDDYKWIQMRNSTVHGTSVFRADLNKSEDMFLHTKFRYIFKTRCEDTEWNLHVINKERLNNYMTISACIVFAFFIICILAALSAILVIYYKRYK